MLHIARDHIYTSSNLALHLLHFWATLTEAKNYIDIIINFRFDTWEMTSPLATPASHINFNSVFFSSYQIESWMAIASDIYFQDHADSISLQLYLLE